MRRGSTSLSLVSILAMLFLYGPIFVLVLYSFNTAHLSMAWRGTTLKWYAALWHDEALLAATANSLLIAVISTIGATLLGGLMALGMERMPLRRQQIIGAAPERLDDDFFDLGGGSLMAAQMVARLRETHPEITIADIYDHPTLAALAAHLDEMAIPTSRLNKNVRPVERKTQAGQVAAHPQSY